MQSFTSHNILAPCFSLRVALCKCFDSGRGLELANAFDEKLFSTIPPCVKNSWLQTWRDAGDMPSWARQVGWAPWMAYEYFFASDFTWRHFSNSQLWDLLKNQGAVLVNRSSDFPKMAVLLRKFAASNCSFLSGLWYGGAVLTKYRADPADDWIYATEVRSRQTHKGHRNGVACSRVNVGRV